jgi:hypothetical protein
MLKKGMLGLGAVVNGVSLTLRPYLSGFRVFANHNPCFVLPFGGYVRSQEEGEAVIKRYKAQILGFSVKG